MIKPNEQNECQPKIVAVYILKRSDGIFDKEGNLIRIKRKYGKHDRKIIKLAANEPDR